VGNLPCSPSHACIVGCSSPIVDIVSTGLKPSGDWLNGSGEVPHDELAPPGFECDDPEGDPVVVLPRLWCPESMLVREPDAALCCSNWDVGDRFTPLAPVDTPLKAP
jgi:hypothetical protein